MDEHLFLPVRGDATAIMAQIFNPGLERFPGKFASFSATHELISKKSGRTTCPAAVVSDPVYFCRQAPPDSW
jgi:hypothetical protein